jgi:hypothetical protein
VAGLLLLPVVIRRGLALDRLGWLGLVGIIVGTGAPYALVVAVGLRFAPAYDAGALNPGCMPLFVALIAATVPAMFHLTFPTAIARFSVVKEMGHAKPPFCRAIS